MISPKSLKIILIFTLLYFMVELIYEPNDPYVFVPIRYYRLMILVYDKLEIYIRSTFI